MLSKQPLDKLLKLTSKTGLFIAVTAHETLIKLAETFGETMQTVLDKAIEYCRYIFLVQTNQAFVALRQNQELWQEELADIRLWDQTMVDGVGE